MPIRLDRRRDLSVVKLICKVDDVIGVSNQADDDGDSPRDEAYAEYLKELDESHLKLTSEPTRLILNFDLKGKDAETVKNSMLGNSGGGGGVSLALGTYQYTVARLTLKAIDNPSDMPLQDQILFKDHNGNGRPNDETLRRLDRIGALANILAAYQELVGAPRADAKNS